MALDMRGRHVWLEARRWRRLGRRDRSGLRRRNGFGHGLRGCVCLGRRGRLMLSRLRLGLVMRAGRQCVGRGGLCLRAFMPVAAIAAATTVAPAATFTRRGLRMRVTFTCHARTGGFDRGQSGVAGCLRLLPRLTRLARRTRFTRLLRRARFARLALRLAFALTARLIAPALAPLLAAALLRAPTGRAVAGSGLVLLRALRALAAAAAALAAPAVAVTTVAPLLAAMTVALAAPIAFATRLAHFARRLDAHRWSGNRGLGFAEPGRDPCK
jgi:hypothetical protein